MWRLVQGYAAVALGASFWGGVGLAVSVLARAGYDVFSTAALRVAVAVLLALAAVLVWGSGKTPIRRRDLWVFAAAGVFGNTVLPVLYFISMRQVGVGLAALFLYMKPMFVVLLAAVTIGEAITARKLGALALGFAGTALIVPAPAAGGSGLLWLGVLAGLGAGMAGAVFAVASRTTVQRYPARVVNAVNLLCAAAVLLPVEGYRLATGAVRYDLAAWPWVLLIGSLLSVIPAGLYIWGMKHVGAGEANIVALMEPVTAVLIGFFFLNERLTTTQLAGILLVLSGAVLVAWRPAPRPARA